MSMDTNIDTSVGESSGNGADDVPGGLSGNPAVRKLYGKQPWWARLTCASTYPGG